MHLVEIFKQFGFKWVFILNDNRSQIIANNVKQYLLTTEANYAFLIVHTEGEIEKIVDKMPSSENNAYYIKDGKRAEISEFDNKWVEVNCKVPVQEVQ